MFNRKEFKKFRKASDLKQGELAEAIGVQPYYISRWELGRLVPNNVHLHKIAVHVKAKCGEELAYKITGVRNADPDRLPELQSNPRQRIVLITYESGLIEWKPFSVFTLQTVAAQFSSIANIQIVEQGA